MVGRRAAIPAAGYGPVGRIAEGAGLLLGGRRLSHVDLQLAQTIADTTEGWRATIASDQTHGVVEYRPDSAAHGAQVFARLDRLALKGREGEDGAPPSAGGAAQSPPHVQADLPALDIVVDDFELDGKPLGKLEVSATSQAGGRDWRLTRLALTTPEARFTGTGQWAGAPARRMTLDFKLELADSGALAAAPGHGPRAQGRQGQPLRLGHVDGLAARARLPEPRAAASRSPSTRASSSRPALAPAACWAC